MHTCWGKKTQTFTSNNVQFLSQCEPGRIDHGDLSDSDFEDERQPEIAIWLPRLEVLIHGI